MLHKILNLFKRRSYLFKSVRVYGVGDGVKVHGQNCYAVEASFKAMGARK